MAKKTTTTASAPTPLTLSLPAGWDEGLTKAQRAECIQAAHEGATMQARFIVQERDELRQKHDRLEAALDGLEALGVAVYDGEFRGKDFWEPRMVARLDWSAERGWRFYIDVTESLEDRLEAAESFHREVDRGQIKTYALVVNDKPPLLNVCHKRTYYREDEVDPNAEPA